MFHEICLIFHSNIIMASSTIQSTQWRSVTPAGRWEPKLKLMLKLGDASDIGSWRPWFQCQEDLMYVWMQWRKKPDHVSGRLLYDVLVRYVLSRVTQHVLVSSLQHHAEYFIGFGTFEISLHSSGCPGLCYLSSTRHTCGLHHRWVTTVMVTSEYFSIAWLEFCFLDVERWTKWDLHRTY